MFYIVAAIIIFELIMKRQMEETLHEEKEILHGKIRLNKFHNKGIALSYLSKCTKLVKYATSAIIAVLGIVLWVITRKKESRLLQLGVSLMLGGAISNLIDRYQYGYVVDYFSFNFGKKLKKIVFNIADLFILLGSILCMVYAFLADKR